MKHLLYLAVSFLCLASYAQISNNYLPPTEPIPVEDSIFKKRGVDIYFTQYFNFSNARDINSRLRSAQYPAVGGFQVFWGGGANKPDL